ncbi:hypothetical protein CgunFtcFv8_000128 [Champsocephalus gunnari]|uniref:Uncharacterized protein n=1 Tax=Champsocephalus gunnari TaxID=52237 RepID=A0AAN8DN81_CHAGU|nr:hypothetical protein CgunFtcFv8_000128 [Champsocephalus gunnari]
MRLNPFTSNLNLRARYTPSRSMPQALRFPILHTDTTRDSHLASFETQQLFAPVQGKEPSADSSALTPPSFFQPELGKQEVFQLNCRPFIRNTV